MTDDCQGDASSAFSCQGAIFAAIDPTSNEAAFSVEAFDVNEAKFLSQIVGPYLGFQLGQEFRFLQVAVQPMNVPFFMAAHFTPGDRELHRRATVDGKFPLQ
jgi:hypothetical protein